jgi:hypothetical protein
MLRTVAEQYPGPTADFTRLLLQSGEDAFFHEHVEPLRDYLEWQWQISFSCVPSTSYERRLVSGRGFQTESISSFSESQIWGLYGHFHTVGILPS